MTQPLISPKISLIGVGGPATSGKDALADLLVISTRTHTPDLRPWIKTYMSAPLEKALLVLNPWVRMTGVERRIVLKAPADADGHAWILYSILHSRVGYDNSKKIANVRELLQRLGTEVGRNMFSQTLWTDIASQSITDLISPSLTYPNGARVVLTGIRFPNEAEMVHALGGRLVWVDRGLAPVNAHSSDNSLTLDNFDIVCDNKGSLADLAEWISIHIPG